MLRDKMGQDGRSAGEAGVVQGRGWGGRRHGFRRSGKTRPVTVRMPDLEYGLLERLRVEMLRAGRGDSTVRLKGGWSQGEVVRLAIRTLAREMALEVPEEEELRRARAKEQAAASESQMAEDDAEDDAEADGQE